MSDAANIAAAAANRKNIKGQQQDILNAFKKDGLAVYAPTSKRSENTPWLLPEQDVDPLADL